MDNASGVATALAVIRRIAPHVTTLAAGRTPGIFQCGRMGADRLGALRRRRFPMSRERRIALNINLDYCRRR